MFLRMLDDPIAGFHQLGWIPGKARFRWLVKLLRFNDCAVASRY